MHLAFYLQSVEEILCYITKTSYAGFFFFKNLITEHHYGNCDPTYIQNESELQVYFWREHTTIAFFNARSEGTCRNSSTRLMRYPMNKGFHSQVWEIPPTVSLSWSFIKNIKALKKNFRSSEVN